MQSITPPPISPFLPFFPFSLSFGFSRRVMVRSRKIQSACRSFFPPLSVRKQVAPACCSSPPFPPKSPLATTRGAESERVYAPPFFFFRPLRRKGSGTALKSSASLSFPFPPSRLANDACRDRLGSYYPSFFLHVKSV